MKNLRKGLDFICRLDEPVQSSTISPKRSENKKMTIRTAITKQLERMESSQNIKKFGFCEDVAENIVAIKLNSINILEQIVESLLKVAFFDWVPSL